MTKISLSDLIHNDAYLDFVRAKDLRSIELMKISEINSLSIDILVFFERFEISKQFKNRKNEILNCLTNDQNSKLNSNLLAEYNEINNLEYRFYKDILTTSKQLFETEVLERNYHIYLNFFNGNLSDFVEIFNNLQYSAKTQGINQNLSDLLVLSKINLIVNNLGLSKSLEFSEYVFSSLHENISYASNVNYKLFFIYEFLEHKYKYQNYTFITNYYIRYKDDLKKLASDEEIIQYQEILFLVGCACEKIGDQELSEKLYITVKEYCMTYKEIDLLWRVTFSYIGLCIQMSILTNVVSHLEILESLIDDSFGEDDFKSYYCLEIQIKYYNEINNIPVAFSKSIELEKKFNSNEIIKALFSETNPNIEYKLVICNELYISFIDCYFSFLNLYGIIYSKMKLNDEALQHYKFCIFIFEKFNNTFPIKVIYELGHVYTNISSLLLESEDSEWEYYIYKSLDFWHKNNDDGLNSLYSYIPYRLLGQYYRKYDINECEFNFINSIKELKKNNGYNKNITYCYALSNLYNILGNVFADENNYDTSSNYYKEAFKYSADLLTLTTHHVDLILSVLYNSLILNFEHLKKDKCQKILSMIKDVVKDFNLFENIFYKRALIVESELKNIF